MRFLPFLVLVYALGCWALHESDAGVVDWYKELIGVPRFQSGSTAPRFTLIEGRNIILTATESNVLAAIEAKDGSIVWRYVFDAEDTIVGFYQEGDAVVTLSGPGGAIARVLDLKTGQVTLERSLHPNSIGQLVDPNTLGKDAAFDTESEDIYALSNGYTITRLDGTTGKPLWVWSSPDQGSLTIYNALISTPETIYAVGVSTSFASYTLHVVALSALDGQVITTAGIPSSITNPISDVFAFKQKSPLVAWLEGGEVKSLPLVPALNSKTQALKGEGVQQLIDVGLSGQGIVVGKTDKALIILRLDEDTSAFKADKAFAELDPSAVFAGSAPYLAKSSWSPESDKFTLEILGSPIVALPFSAEKHGSIVHFAFHLLPPGEPQIFATTSSGAIQLYQGAELKWTREEALASSTFAEFVELPEGISAGANAIKDEEFSRRVFRHVVMTQDLPRYLSSFVRRFVTGSYASATSSASASSDGALSRDAFGFRQVIVTATRLGKIFGIDSSNGNIIWSRYLVSPAGGSIVPMKVYTIKSVSDGVEPEVLIVAQRHTMSSTETVVYHLNALTGVDLTPGVTVFHGPTVEAFLLDYQPKFVVLLDEDMKVHLYPDVQEARLAFEKVAQTLTFPLRSSVERRHGVTGYRIAFNKNVDERSLAHPAWVLPLPPGEEVQALLPQASRGPVASLGKVLGNRTTLYKYLNPRLFTVLTVSSSKNVCGLYIVDGAKGTVVYQTRIPANKGTCDVKAALIENWLVYHYYETEVPSGNAQGTKGYRLVTVELYEGQGIDEKTRSSDMSPFVNATTNFFSLEESYVFPHGLTALAPTTTKFGITTKDLIVATRNGKVQSFPRRLLSPRRPHRKPTAEEVEEGLFQYEPVVFDEPKRVISHKYEVVNVHQVVTSPALLESTSLVLAFGLDMFLTRVAPSNTFDILSEDFNKVQLILTVSGLLVAILFTRPMVQRKRLRENWYL